MLVRVSLMSEATSTTTHNGTELAAHKLILLDA